MKFGRSVLQVNTHRLMEKDFWFDVSQFQDGDKCSHMNKHELSVFRRLNKAASASSWYYSSVVLIKMKCYVTTTNKTYRELFQWLCVIFSALKSCASLTLTLYWDEWDWDLYSQTQTACPVRVSRRLDSDAPDMHFANVRLNTSLVGSLGLAYPEQKQIG